MSAVLRRLEKLMRKSLVAAILLLMTVDAPLSAPGEWFDSQRGIGVTPTADSVTTGSFDFNAPVADADPKPNQVVVPAGTLARYGLDYSTLASRNPTLIYVSCTGFGQSGPYAEKKGYDTVFQAMGGIMSLTGERGGGPV